MKQTNETTQYLKSCRSEFWQKVFVAELDYLLQCLNPGDEVLSVGCGPAHIESGLAAHGFRVVGLDVSREALACAPDSVRSAVVSAEEMPFPEAAFDVVLYIASLQFIENYRTALERTAQVLKPGGRVIAMLLNPASAFFKNRYATEGSYVRKLRHTNLQELEQTAAEWFDTQGEYFLGVDGEGLFDSADPATAALYVIKGVKNV
ncbi:MAG: class I SAM-dependent methyltransferase [Desulfuromonadaceae bacterium]